MTRSKWHVVKVTDSFVFIEDMDTGGMSVTNDAEAVYEAVQLLYPNKRLVYKDSMGTWDEIYMVNDCAYFKGYQGVL
jgi:hypothetical protein